MRSTGGFRSTRTWLCGAMLCVLGGLAVPSAYASGAEDLKLMVLDCFTEEKIDSALVEVVLWRSGQGQIDSDSDYTDEGYVEFSFDDLEDDDEARVTVTPPDGNADASHTYYWVEGEDPQNPDGWDLAGTLDDLCEDGWWDRRNHVFECLYRDPEK
ncbi:MAG: hypothetical protein GF330_06775 [Candidatus Eisenbacteria bacterium]|nr:hypothetical protein [Candidatus Eisenbacteria bacterium]